MKGLESVKEYYGKVLSNNKDLKTNACCLAEATPEYIKAILSDIHPEIMEKFYGCGSPFPFDLEGKIVLDLGSGSGRDSFVLSKLVGQHGKIIGIDMTMEQIDLANKHIGYHTKKFGYSNSNVEFITGYIEDLAELGIKDSSIDVVISNCVINLSPSKEIVFSEIFRVLKPGGELFFSDIFSSRRIPEYLVKNHILMGECLSGALYTEDFRRILTRLNCNDYRMLSNKKVTLGNSDIEKLVGKIDFFSQTIRAFKLDLEDRCEDYGQFAQYMGTINESPNYFILDNHHLFEKNKPVAICENTAKMLSETRYRKHFKVFGDKINHFGLFNCDSLFTSNSSIDEKNRCC